MPFIVKYRLEKFPLNLNSELVLHRNISVFSPVFFQRLYVNERGNKLRMYCRKKFLE